MLSILLLSGCASQPPIQRQIKAGSPLPFPYMPSGLAFQRDPGDFEGSRSPRPIDGAAVDGSGGVWLTFAKERLLVGFTGSDFQSTMLGNPVWGGANEEIGHPGMIRATKRQLTFADLFQAEVRKLSLPEGVTSPQPTDARVVDICAAGHLLMNEGAGYQVLRADGSMKHFQAPPAGDYLSRLEGDRPVLASLDERLRLLAYGSDGGIEWSMNLVFDRPRVLCDLVVAENCYWLLLRGNTQQSEIFVIDKLGTVRNYWYLDTFWDGLALDETLFLLYNRKQGSAQTYSRR